ncbi:MAG: ParB/RepB/Spo0J family partition protein [Rudaea sp.]
MNQLHNAALEPRLIMVPIARLNPIANGVRKTNGIAIDALAASIKAEGLLQNLTVVVDHAQPLAGAEEFQHYQVIAGSRRLRALRYLVEHKDLPDDYEVPCRLIDEMQALSASLAENAIREAMHPADEFTAFRALIDQKKSIEDVAARFGVTPLVVQRRLKLANVAPKLFELYRQDKMTLDQMMALAISDDHAAQEKAWFKAESWQRSPQEIKRALTKKEINASQDPIARFVGLQEYERAGGVVHKDLFSEKNDGYIADGALLQKLAAKKLEAIAERVRNEAWSWVVIRPTLDYAELQAFTRAQPKGHRKPTDVEKKRIDELTKERTAAEKQANALGKLEHTESREQEIYTLDERINEIGDELAGMVDLRQTWDPKILAQAGAIITINYGDVEVHRGLVKGRLKLGKEAKAAAAQEKAKAGHSESLTRELTAHITFAIAAELIANPGAAIIALAHGLALDQFYLISQIDAGSSIVPIHANAARKSSIDGDSPDLAKIATERKAIEALLPKKSAELLAFLLKDANAELVQRLLAYCIAESIDAVAGDEKNLRAKPLAEALKLNMATRWTAKPGNYLSRVSAAQILAALADAGCDKAAIANAEKLKKADLIKHAQPLLANWLPKVLRFV